MMTALTGPGYRERVWQALEWAGKTEAKAKKPAFRLRAIASFEALP